MEPEETSRVPCNTLEVVRQLLCGLLKTTETERGSKHPQGSLEKHKTINKKKGISFNISVFSQSIFFFFIKFVSFRSVPKSLK